MREVGGSNPPWPPFLFMTILLLQIVTEILNDEKVENPGFDPGASSLLTTHSTD